MESKMKKMNIQKLLKYAVDVSASDLHLTVGYPPIIRLDGVLNKIDIPQLSKEDVKNLIYEILTEEQIKRFEKDLELDIAYSISKLARFRTNVYYQMRGLAVAFRIIPNKIMTLEEMNVPEGVYTLARKTKGLVLVTGPTGSGKSTTLAAVINLINKERKAHILTIEDPIEYVHSGISCMINQREIGRNTRSFSSSLRAALREDPDVILVGEMRDFETIALAITAAETGHLVLATLHTSSAPETIDRVIDVFPSDQQNQIRSVFASTIEGVVSQKLVLKKGGKGRTAVMEVMIATPAVRNLVRERKTYQMNTVIQTGTEYGMQSMDQGLMALLGDNKIDKNTAITHAVEKKAFQDWKGETRNILQHVKGAE